MQQALQKLLLVQASIIAKNSTMENLSATQTNSLKNVQN